MKNARLLLGFAVAVSAVHVPLNRAFANSVEINSVALDPGNVSSPGIIRGVRPIVGQHAAEGWQHEVPLTDGNLRGYLPPLLNFLLEDSREAHISTTYNASGAHSRIPGPHGNEKRPQGFGGTPHEGPSSHRPYRL